MFLSYYFMLYGKSEVGGFEFINCYFFFERIIFLFFFLYIIFMFVKLNIYYSDIVCINNDFSEVV